MNILLEFCSHIPSHTHLPYISVIGVGVSTHLRAKAAEESEPEVAHGECEVLVEEVAQKLAHAVVGPAAVH